MKVAKSALLPHSARQLYELVADIESYPAFLPRCHRAQIVRQTESEVVATLGIKFAGLDLSFSTLNTLTPYEHIQLALHKGPFNRLNGDWRFEALSDSASKVSLTMDFEFDSLFGKTVISSAFQSIVAAQFDAFQHRAQMQYGAQYASN